MHEIIWHWRKGDKKIYTGRTDIAEKALKEGYLVMGLKDKPHIISKY